MRMRDCRVNIATSSVDKGMETGAVLTLTFFWRMFIL